MEFVQCSGPKMPTRQKAGSGISILHLTTWTGHILQQSQLHLQVNTEIGSGKGVKGYDTSAAFINIHSECYRMLQDSAEACILQGV